MKSDRLKDLTDFPDSCGFGPDNPPDDSKCPVTRRLPEFAPSRILDEARSGWFPKGSRACVGCELCSGDKGASFPNCIDRMLLACGKREGFIPRAFGGALDAIVTLQIDGAKQNRLDWLTPDIEIAKEDSEGEIGLFVGCAPYYDVLLADRVGIKLTSETHSAVRLLNAVGVKPVVLRDEVCCGGDRLHAGDRGGFMALGTRNARLFKDRGVKTIVTTCNDCRYTLGARYPGRIEGWDFEVMSVTDFLMKKKVAIPTRPVRAKIAVQPPDRYSDPGNIDSMRRLLAGIPELLASDIPLGHPSTFGSWNQFGSISKSMESAMLRDAESTGAAVLVVQSTRVLTRLLEGRQPGSWEETSIGVIGLYSFLASAMR